MTSQQRGGNSKSPRDSIESSRKIVHVALHLELIVGCALLSVGWAALLVGIFPAALAICSTVVGVPRTLNQAKVIRSRFLFANPTTAFRVLNHLQTALIILALLSSLMAVFLNHVGGYVFSSKVSMFGSQHTPSTLEYKPTASTNNIENTMFQFRLVTTVLSVSLIILGSIVKFHLPRVMQLFLLQALLNINRSTTISQQHKQQKQKQEVDGAALMVSRGGHKGEDGEELLEEEELRPYPVGSSALSCGSSQRRRSSRQTVSENLTPIKVQRTINPTAHLFGSKTAAGAGRRRDSSNFFQSSGTDQQQQYHHHQHSFPLTTGGESYHHADGSFSVGGGTSSSSPPPALSVPSPSSTSIGEEDGQQLLQQYHHHHHKTITSTTSPSPSVPAAGPYNPIQHVVLSHHQSTREKRGGERKTKLMNNGGDIGSVVGGVLYPSSSRRIEGGEEDPFHSDEEHDDPYCAPSDEHGAADSAGAILNGKNFENVSSSADLGDEMISSFSSPDLLQEQLGKKEIGQRGSGVQTGKTTTPTAAATTASSSPRHHFTVDEDLAYLEASISASASSPMAALPIQEKK